MAKRFALRIQPVPSIVLEYDDGGKTRLRTVKLHEARLKTDADVDVLTSKARRLCFPQDEHSRAP